MEIQHFQVCVNLVVGIQLIFLAGIGSCMHSSSFSNGVGKGNSNYDVNSRSIEALTYLEKYISESYFEKHDSLLDSDFEDFITHELPLGSCEMLQDNHDLVPRLSVLHRHLIGEGSHRHLSSSITFNIQLGTISKLPAHFCEAIIIERLPSGIFADPFELQHLIERGVFMDAAVFGDTNLELPSVASNRSVVEVHLGVSPDILSRHQNRLDITVELPLHARYPSVGATLYASPKSYMKIRVAAICKNTIIALLPVGESGFSTVAFGAPDLFMRCSFKGRSNNQSCLFMLTNNSTESKSGGVVWKVPCGNKEHARAVSTVTFLSAVVSALLIVLTSIYKSDIQSYGKK